MPPAAKKKDTPALPISDRTVASLVQYFKLLADDSRLRILLTLAREGETHVSALCQMLGQSQPAVSHHLTLLRMSGLVGYRRVTPSACRNIIVRAAKPMRVPWTRVPSLMINVSADAIAASDTTHRLIAVAMTILFI